MSQKSYTGLQDFPFMYNASTSGALKPKGPGEKRVTTAPSSSGATNEAASANKPERHPRDGAYLEVRRDGTVQVIVTRK